MEIGHARVYLYDRRCGNGAHPASPVDVHLGEGIQDTVQGEGRTHRRKCLHIATDPILQV